MLRSNIGIGDILLLRLYTLNCPLHPERNDLKILLPLEVWTEYREGSETYLSFIQELIRRLWPEEYSNIFVLGKNAVASGGSIQGYLSVFGSWSKVTNYSLTPFFQEVCKTPLVTDVPKYIVLNTKLRFDRLSPSKLQEYKDVIKAFAQNATFQTPVVIMGEQYLEANKEVEQHNMSTCYEELMCLAQNPLNKVIDMTVKTVNNNPSMSQFERDVNILSFSCASVHLGYGGSFCMSLVFAPTCMAWTVGIDYPFHNFNKKNKFLSEQILSLETFLTSLTEL